MTKTPGRFLGFLVAAAEIPLGAQITYDRLLNATKEPQNWLTSVSGTAS